MNEKKFHKPAGSGVAGDDAITCFGEMLLLLVDGRAFADESSSMAFLFGEDELRLVVRQAAGEETAFFGEELLVLLVAWLGVCCTESINLLLVDGAGADRSGF